MRIRAYVPDGDIPTWGANPAGLPAFWVECSRESAEREFVPRLSARQRSEMAQAVARSERQIGLMEGGRWTHCFVVMANLSRILPMHFSFPFDNQWNGYSPFKRCGPFRLHRLTRIPLLTRRLNPQKTLG